MVPALVVLAVLIVHDDTFFLFLDWALLGCLLDVVAYDIGTRNWGLLGGWTCGHLLSDFLRMLLLAKEADVVTGAVGEEGQVDQDVSQGHTHEHPAYTVTSLNLWHPLCEAHETVREHHDGALIEDLHQVGKWSLEGPEVEQVDDRIDGDHDLKGDLRPEKVNPKDHRVDKGKSAEDEIGDPREGIFSSLRGIMTSAIEDSAHLELIVLERVKVVREVDQADQENDYREDQYYCGHIVTEFFRAVPGVPISGVYVEGGSQD